jgi:heme a synthase
MKIRNRVTGLAWVTLVLAWIVILLGATTRLNDAGLGCPDWPGCYGKWIVPAINQYDESDRLFTVTHQKKAWLEMIHRYAAAVLIFLSITLIFLLKRYRRLLKITHYFPFLILLLLIFQGLLGRWTVTLQLHPVIVTLHLLGGFLFLSLLWSLICALSPIFETIPNAREKKLLLFSQFLFVLLLLQITLGAWTSSQYAALVCSTVPFCSNITWSFYDLMEPFQWFGHLQANFEGGRLSTSARAAIQMIHRTGALIFGLSSLIFIGKLFKTRNSVLHRLAGLFLGVLILQILMGVANIFWFLPQWSAIMHNGIAALLLLIIITFMSYLKKS